MLGSLSSLLRPGHALTIQNDAAFVFEEFHDSLRLVILDAHFLDLRIVGERLNVKTVLEGSIRKAGNRIRIHVQLIKVSDGYHLWSQRYDRELKAIFEVQDEISRAVANPFEG